MKYYIVGKKTKEGNLKEDSEKGSLSEYFELGWEYIVSHLYVKHLFVIGTLNHDDVIVTIEDRMFMYQGFWNNVMSFEDYYKLNQISNKYNFKNNLKTIDVCELIEDKREEMLPKLIEGKYEHWNADKDIIRNIKYVNINHLDTSVPYCCLHIRYRKWASFRNLSKKFWDKVIKKIELSGLKVYIFGKEAKDFADGENIFHVNLDEYASLLNNINCKYLIGNMSGGTLVAQTFSNKNCKNYVIIADEQTYMEYKENNVYKIFYHISEFNFSDAPIIHVSCINDVDDKTVISVEQLIDEI